MTQDTDKILKACRNSLLSFSLLNNKNFKAPYHIKKLANALMRVEAGHCKRLIVTMPPRHGKTFLCSQMFPSWYLGRNPDKYIITATYNQDFSNDLGRKVRDIVLSDNYKAVFPGVEIRKDSQAVNRLMTTKDGQYFAVGVGSPTTGRGAHLFLIDDPHKDRLEADSRTYLDRISDWFSAVAYTRLMPGGAVVIMMTRWNEADLVGQVLKNSHEDWEIINFPAVVGNQSLWPEMYTMADMSRIKATMSEYDWNALYMQDPTPREGILFREEMMPKGYDTEYAGYIIGVDPAISQKQDADETGIVVLGIRFESPLAIDELETLHGKWTFPEQIKLLKHIYKKWHKPDDGARVLSMVVEDVAYQKALVQQLAEEDLPVVPLKINGEKYLRANYITPLMNQGRVRINSDTLRNQMYRFRGKSEKNDMVDAFVNALTYAKDYESMGYTKKVNEFEGMSHQQIFMKRYMDRFRRETENVTELFSEDVLQPNTDDNYF